jgi:DNA-binding MarR family transcriptional regulator
MGKRTSGTAVSAWAHLFRVYRQLLEQAEGDLKKAGLPPLGWYDVLLELHDAPEQRLRQFELGEKILLPKYNLSRLLDRLDAEQLISREACKEDARGSYVKLLTKGRKLLKQMWSVYGQTIQHTFAEKLTTKDKQDLIRILTKLKT